MKAVARPVWIIFFYFWFALYTWSCSVHAGHIGTDSMDDKNMPTVCPKLSLLVCPLLVSAENSSGKGLENKINSLETKCKKQMENFMLTCRYTDWCLWCTRCGWWWWAICLPHLTYFACVTRFFLECRTYCEHHCWLQVAQCYAHHYQPLDCLCCLLQHVQSHWIYHKDTLNIKRTILVIDNDLHL